MMLPMPLIAILAAALGYWLLGALWYSMLFGRIWSEGLAAQGVRIESPSRAQLVTKLLLTFVATVAAATAVAWVLQCFSVAGMAVALRLALVLGVGIAASAIGIAYTWESKPLRVYLIDAGYHVLGILSLR